MRYLVRLANSQGYTPRDVEVLQARIRELLGSADKIGNLRISTSAIEFDLFAEQTDINRSKSLLEAKISKVVTLNPVPQREGIEKRYEKESICSIRRDSGKRTKS